MLFSPIEQCLDPGHCSFSELRQGILHPWRKLPLLAARCVALFAITRIAEMKKLVSILMDFPNDSERSWIVGHHFDSTVWFMDIYCAHRGVTPLAARPPLERD